METTKNNNKYNFCFEKFPCKVSAVFAVAFLFAGVLNVNEAFAYFSDSATIDGTTFSAGTLKISLDNTSVYSSGLMYPTDNNSTSIGISNTGSLDSQYIVQTTLSGSDNSACDYVTMTATSPTESYTGRIKDFTSATTTTTETDWSFDFQVDSDAPASVWGKTCFFKWTFTSWQNDMPDATSGFSNVKYKLGSIKIGKAVVLNEVLPDPDENSLAPANKEFIELFNNSNVSIDLAGWQVSEMDGGDERKYTITTETSGSLRAVPFDGSTTISPKGWIVLLLSDGTALNNDGDTIRLYDGIGGNKLDEYTYAGGKPKGHSDGRDPDGVGNWVDPIPTPGEANNSSDNLPDDLEISLKVKIEATEELIATSTVSITSTVPTISDIDILENVSTSTEAVEVESLTTASSTATTTEDVIEEEDATSTPDILPSLDIVPENEEEESAVSSLVELVPDILTEEIVPENTDAESAVPPVVEPEIVAETPVDVVGEVSSVPEVLVVAEVCPIEEVSDSAPLENQ